MKPAVWKPWRIDWAVDWRLEGEPWRKVEKSISCWGLVSWCSRVRT